jgi:hypothetical protein
MRSGLSAWISSVYLENRAQSYTLRRLLCHFLVTRGRRGTSSLFETFARQGSQPYWGRGTNGLVRHCITPIYSQLRP